jgi:transposase-like protein
MKKQRKHYTPEEKVAILRRHLLEQVPISELCDKQGLQPTLFYRWQKEFFENGAAAFQPKARPSHSAERERIAYLESPTCSLFRLRRRGGPYIPGSVIWELSKGCPTYNDRFRHADFRY